MLAALAVGGCGVVTPTPIISNAPAFTTSPLATPVVTASPIVTPSPVLLTLDEAVAAARQAADQYADGDVLWARIGAYTGYTNGYAVKTPPIPRPEALVWEITLGTNPGPLMAQGETFLVDAIDGHVVEQWSWIS